MGLKFGDSPSHWTQPPPMVISEHAHERLTPDRQILYIQYEYIYSNFNELLFSYSFNLLYCFILVMRNNIMFCGFSSFLLLNYYYLLYGIYEHTLKYTNVTNSSKQYVLFLLRREWYLTLRCTLLLFGCQLLLTSRQREVFISSLFC